MAEAPQFTPEELDRLEDSLEGLERAELGLLEEETEPVRARLADYRAILLLARDAFPMEDVPSGVLDSVLQVARDPQPGESVGVAPVPAARAGGSWWDRVRRTFLLPALAVAGSAALILIIVRPSVDEPSPVDRVAHNEAPATAKGEAAQPTTPIAEPEQAEQDADERAAEDGVLHEIAVSRMEPDPGAAPADDPGPPAQAGRATDTNVAGKLGAATETKGTAKPDPLAKSQDDGKPTPRWDLIARGDRARTQGDCTTAISDYEAALSDTDDRVKARANAGLGLCESTRGRASAAREYFERARDLDPEVGDFIDEGAPRTEAPAKARSSSKPARKSKTVLEPDDAFDKLE
jgi:tetratricopeptide (TPR) repeat protein